MIFYFCHRIASECMMVISSIVANVCLCVVSLYLCSGSLVISADRMVNTREIMMGEGNKQPPLC